jgi:hypothetical protein
MRTDADKELLELAAKAAGYRLEWDGDPEWWKPMYYEGKTYHSFNPLEDDGDALRLAVKLKIDVKPDYTYEGPWEDGGKLRDPYAATRRAIVRAAAKIGEESYSGI